MLVNNIPNPSLSVGQEEVGEVRHLGLREPGPDTSLACTDEVDDFDGWTPRCE